jgi:serine/threonine protein kinase
MCSFTHLVLQSNVLVQGNGRACLADFGLSTMVLGFTNPSYFTSSIKGNIRWAAAELFEVPEDDDEENTAVLLSTECDIYSFGSIALQVSNLKFGGRNIPFTLHVF